MGDGREAGCEIGILFLGGGSEEPIMDTYPSYWYAYNEDVLYLDRVDQAIEWLTMPLNKQPGLVFLYFDEPDGTGHYAGSGLEPAATDGNLENVSHLFRTP